MSKGSSGLPFKKGPFFPFSHVLRRYRPPMSSFPCPSCRMGDWCSSLPCFSSPVKWILSVFLVSISVASHAQITQQEMEDAFYNALVDFSSVVGDGGAIFTVPMNPDYFELAGYLTTTAEGFDGPLFSFAYEWNPIIQNLPLYLRNLSSNQLSHTSYLSGILDRSNHLYNVAWSNWMENVQIKQSLAALRTNIASRLDVPLSDVVSGVSDVSDGIAQLDSDLNGVGGLVDAIQHDTSRLLEVSRASTNLLEGLSGDLSDAMSDLQDAIEDGLADINVDIEVLLQQINDMYTYIESLSSMSGDLYNLIVDLPTMISYAMEPLLDFNVEDLPTHYDVTVDNWPNMFDESEWWLAMEALSNLVEQAEVQNAAVSNLSSMLSDEWFPATTNYYASSTNYFSHATNYFASMMPSDLDEQNYTEITNAIVATNAYFDDIEADVERDWDEVAEEEPPTISDPDNYTPPSAASDPLGLSSVSDDLDHGTTILLTRGAALYHVPRMEVDLYGDSDTSSFFSRLTSVFRLFWGALFSIWLCLLYYRTYRQLRSMLFAGQTPRANPAVVGVNFIADDGHLI